MNAKFVTMREASKYARNWTGDTEIQLRRRRHERRVNRIALRVESEDYEFIAVRCDDCDMGA